MLTYEQRRESAIENLETCSSLLTSARQRRQEIEQALERADRTVKLLSARFAQAVEDARSFGVNI